MQTHAVTRSPAARGLLWRSVKEPTGWPMAVGWAAGSHAERSCSLFGRREAPGVCPVLLAPRRTCLPARGREGLLVRGDGDGGGTQHVIPDPVSWRSNARHDAFTECSVTGTTVTASCISGSKGSPSGSSRLMPYPASLWRNCCRTSSTPCARGSAPPLARAAPSARLRLSITSSRSATPSGANLGIPSGVLAHARAHRVELALRFVHERHVLLQLGILLGQLLLELLDVRRLVEEDRLAVAGRSVLGARPPAAIDDFHGLLGSLIGISELQKFRISSSPPTFEPLLKVCNSELLKS